MPTRARTGEEEEAAKLVAYARSLGSASDLSEWSRASADVDHIGAKLADAVLQAGVGYESFVRPRVREMIRAFPQTARLSGLRSALSAHGPGALIGCEGGRKPATFAALVDALDREGIETVDDLREFVSDRWRANRLRGVSGVGPKTVAFLKLLVGVDAVAVDQHILGALAAAGIAPCDPSEAETLFRRAAAELQMTMSQLDAFFWRHGSGTSTPA